MPGTYNHWPTVQGKRDDEMVYNSTGSNWVIVDAAQDFTIAMDDYYFMIGGTKELEIRVTNNGTIEATGLTLSIQVNNKFTYVTGSIGGGESRIAPDVERFEGGGLYIEFPSTFTVPAGETVAIRFQVTAAG